MTYVGAGAYTRGCDPQENTAMQQNCAANAQPAHTVQLSAGYCIGKTEVSVGDYRRCVGEGRCQAPADLACAPLTATWSVKQKDAEAEKLPINCLLWAEAEAVCGHLGGRLPTEAEWEKAARGTDERRYPFGNAAPTDCQRGVNWGGGEGCALALWAVGSGAGSQSLSAAKALDMAGNLWEWTADWYSDMAYKACADGCKDPTGPQTGVVRVRRGGGYKSLKVQELRASFREYHLPDLARSDLLGVRCAKSL
jgi:formylglycine-generating enzyme required for sulfatase activity